MKKIIVVVALGIALCLGFGVACDMVDVKPTKKATKAIDNAKDQASNAVDSAKEKAVDTLNGTLDSLKVK